MDQNKIKYLLMVGFISLLCSILLAYNSPAESYELSIYTSTPIMFWIGLGFVFIISLVVSFDSNSKEELIISLLLVGMAILSIVSLPLIRNYYYFGMSDSISHLEIANSIGLGNIDLGESFYPAIHLLGVFIRVLTGLPLRISMMLTLPIFASVFVIFIPFILKIIHRKFNKDLMIIGTYSAFMFLPINNIGIFFEPRPSTQALLFSSALVYLFLRYNSEKNIKWLIIYVILYLGLLFLHPQHALSFILLISVIVIWGRWYIKDNSFSIRLPIMFGLIFSLWVTHKWIFQQNLRLIFNRLFYGDLYSAAGITQRGMSLSFIGGSLLEIFFKIFLVTLIFGILTLIYIYKSRNTDFINKDWINFFIIGLMPITLIFFIYLLVTESPDQGFRYIGIVFMIITITGAYSFFHLTKNIKKIKKIVILIFISANLLLSIPIFFNSPWIYLGNSQVTESDFSGYKTSFSLINDNFEFSSIRFQSFRFYTITQGLPLTPILRGKFIFSPDHFDNQSLFTYYKSKTYLAFTESELIMDAQLYRGFRFSFDDFEYLERHQNINRIQSNEGYKLYIISPEE